MRASGKIYEQSSDLQGASEKARESNHEHPIIPLSELASSYPVRV